MQHDTPPVKVASTDQLGHADETHAAPAVLDTDDIEVLREALAVAWGDSMTAQLKINDQAADIERLRDTYGAVQAENADLSTERRHLLLEITRLRAMLLRQYKADAACYAIPLGCTEAEHISVLSEHDAVHALLAAEFKA